MLLYCLFSWSRDHNSIIGPWLRLANESNIVCSAMTPIIRASVLSSCKDIYERQGLQCYTILVMVGSEGGHIVHHTTKIIWTQKLNKLLLQLSIHRYCMYYAVLLYNEMGIHSSSFQIIIILFSSYKQIEVILNRIIEWMVNNTVMHMLQ